VNYARQRYWLRSYLGYPPVRDALPNTTHFALAALQHAGFVPRLITQNVDGLHHKALSLSPNISPSSAILELHGTLHQVRCNRGHIADRALFQDWLSEANPYWKDFADEIERTGIRPRTNPDGDVAIEHLGVSYDEFVIPDCPQCLLENYRNPVHKPQVVFFGESIPKSVKDQSFLDVEHSDRLLVIGTTLATYSAYRLLKRAIELHKPVMLLNVGPSRADSVPEVDKINIPAAIMREVARSVINELYVSEDPVVAEMLRSGITKPPLPDDGDAQGDAGQR